VTLRRLILTLLALTGLGRALAAPSIDVAAELRTTQDLVSQSLREYHQGNTDQAFRTARSAYLDHFEYAEPPLRVLNPDLILEMEYRFSDLRNGMKAGQTLTDLQKIAGDIGGSLRKAESIVSGTGILGPTLAATGGFTILFREGLEAALLIAAIFAYLDTSRNTRLRKAVWYGGAAALLATVFTWALATYVLSIAPISRELISAVTSAIAVVILFSLSFWLLQQSDRRRSVEFMRAKVSQAVQGGSLMALGLITFTTIYREGFETVLFYQALTVASGPVTGYMYRRRGAGGGGAGRGVPAAVPLRPQVTDRQAVPGAGRGHRRVRRGLYRQRRARVPGGRLAERHQPLRQFPENRPERGGPHRHPPDGRNPRRAGPDDPGVPAGVRLRPGDGPGEAEAGYGTA